MYVSVYLSDNHSLTIIFQNFRKSLQECWGMSAKLHNIPMRRVSFKESGPQARAMLEFPLYASGWSIVPESTPCSVSQLQVYVTLLLRGFVTLLLRGFAIFSTRSSHVALQSTRVCELLFNHRIHS